MAQADVVRVIRARLAELEEELRRFDELRQERDTLQSTLRALTLGGRPQPILATGAATEEAGADSSRKKRYEVTPAILALLRREPGLTSPQVADRLEHVIVTARRDPRRAIVARVSELVDLKQLRRTSDGRLYVKEEGGKKNGQGGEP